MKNSLSCACPSGGKSPALPVSCLPVSLFADFFKGAYTLEEWARFGKEIGLDFIDINVRCLPQLDADALGALKERLALPLMMVTTYSDFSNPDAQARGEAVRAAARDIAAAGALGAKYIRLTAGQHYENAPEAETIDHIAACFEECLPAAEAAGVKILLENHSRPGAWQYDDFDFHMERMCALWERVKPLPIGVNYDTANACALSDWKRLVNTFAGRIETVHLNELASVTPLRYCCVGEGIVPLEEQLRAVLATGFDGPICVEEACMEGREGVRRAIGHTHELLGRIRQ